jgi:hypothetical protein
MAVTKRLAHGESGADLDFAATGEIARLICPATSNSLARLDSAVTAPAETEEIFTGTSECCWCRWSISSTRPR